MLFLCDYKIKDFRASDRAAAYQRGLARRANKQQLIVNSCVLLLDIYNEVCVVYLRISVVNGSLCIFEDFP